MDEINEKFASTNVLEVKNIIELTRYKLKEY